MYVLCIGVDIGGVIIDQANDGTEKALSGPNYLNAEPVAGAFDAIREIGERRFGRGVVVVSKCGEEREQRIREWLKHHDFYRRTGVSPERVHFCRTRQEKAPIRARLQVTHFVDDRLEVLGYLAKVGVSDLFWFRPDEEGERQYGAVLHEAGLWRCERGWPDVLDRLFPNLQLPPEA